MKQLLTRYEHGNTKYGSDDVDRFKELRKKGLTVKQIIKEMALDTTEKALARFLTRNQIVKRS